MNEHTAKGFLAEMEKTALVSALLAGGALLGAGVYGAKKLILDPHRKKKKQQQDLKRQQLHSNRFGRIAPRMDPRSF